MTGVFVPGDQHSGKRLTLPSGLLGVLITMAFVRGVNLEASSSAERTQSALDRTALPSAFWKSVGENNEIYLKGHVQKR